MRILQTKKENSFKPEFNENLKLPLKEQVEVFISDWPSNGELGIYKQASFARGTGEVTVTYKDDLLLTRCVGKITNLELSDGTKITTGAELASTTNRLLVPLIVEIRDKLLYSLELLSQEEKKASV